MSDSLERLYQAVIAAKDLDPATSQPPAVSARSRQRWPKKLAEEAIEVVIDAVNGKTDAVGPRKAPTCSTNLTVLWASAA